MRGRQVSRNDNSLCNVDKCDAGPLSYCDTRHGLFVSTVDNGNCMNHINISMSEVRP